MKLKFTKMHGIGNDYIYINCFEQKISKETVIFSELAAKLSDRHYGIGGDGMILIEPSNVADAKMRLFNADGSEAKMCGNGVRCVAKFLFDNNLVNEKLVKIETLSGIKLAEVVSFSQKISLIKVNIGSPQFETEKIPVNFNEKFVINKVVKFGENEYNINCVSVGNPHCVLFLDEISDVNLKMIENDFKIGDFFPDGVNIEIVKVVDRTNLKMRVWERGSGETMACGTGACASVAAAIKNNLCDLNENVRVQLLGGGLTINFDGKNIFMTGEAEKVFEGEIIV